MILVSLLSIIKLLFDLVFSILPSLPAFPESLSSSIEYVLNIVFDTASLIGLFVHLDTVRVLLPLAIVVINFNRIYQIVMWIIKKIPALSVK